MAFERYLCPVYNREIDEGECMECSMAAEGMGPHYTAVDMEAANPDYERICLECEHHPVMDFG